MNIIFLDYDGVIRIPPPDGSQAWAIITPDSDFCGATIKRLGDACDLIEAKLVISSDWRDFGKDSCTRHLGTRLYRRLHPDWATIRSHGLTRWMEVALWLEQHPEVERFAILEDTKQHFDGAPERIASRIVWCNNRHGFVPELFYKLMGMFAPNPSPAGA